MEPRFPRPSKPESVLRGAGELGFETRNERTGAVGGGVDFAGAPLSFARAGLQFGLFRLESLFFRRKFGKNRLVFGHCLIAGGFLGRNYLLELIDGRKKNLVWVEGIRNRSGRFDFGDGRSGFVRGFRYGSDFNGRKIEERGNFGDGFNLPNRFRGFRGCRNFIHNENFPFIRFGNLRNGIRNVGDGNAFVNDEEIRVVRNGRRGNRFDNGGRRLPPCGGGLIRRNDGIEESHGFWFYGYFKNIVPRSPRVCKKSGASYNGAAKNGKTIRNRIQAMDYSKAKELLKLQQEAQKIQNELSNTHIEAEVDGVVLTFDGQMKCVAVAIEDASVLSDQKRLEKAILEAANKGLKKSQEIAAEKMKTIMGSMGLDLPPGFQG